MDTCLIYMTAGSMEEAKKIGKTLVVERLAACVNLIDKMHSVYWWEGKVQEDDEVIMIAKTRNSLLPTLTEKVKSIHSYTVPCIVSVPITDGNRDFLAWIEKETSGEAS
jgi:periplasmic divalent cation tolerance protein